MKEFLLEFATNLGFMVGGLVAFALLLLVMISPVLLASHFNSGWYLLTAIPLYTLFLTVTRLD